MANVIRSNYSNDSTNIFYLFIKIINILSSIWETQLLGWSFLIFWKININRQQFFLLLKRWYSYDSPWKKKLTRRKIIPTIFGRIMLFYNCWMTQEQCTSIIIVDALLRNIILKASAKTTSKKRTSPFSQFMLKFWQFIRFSRLIGKTHKRIKNSLESAIIIRVNLKKP